ncbi:MAG: UpxY family transcription antiterminator [Flavobacteriales bacterium]|nr:UpxY family transcription antiterminator [Flavobacteriales bacterium]
MNKPQSSSTFNGNDPHLFKWFVIYTKPRHELKVNDRLNSMGIKSYCPTVVKVSQWSDRKKKIKTPALPSILFVNIQEANRNLVFDCPGVVRYMFFDKKIVSVPQKEIDTIKSHLEGKNCVSVNTSLTNVGDSISLEQFNNESGEIIKVSSNRIWVKLSSLNMIIILDI